MKGRAFNKRLKWYRTSLVSDGFSGNTVTSELVANLWAKIETVNGGNISFLETYGILNANDVIQVTVRNRAINLEKDYFEYRGKKYVIKTSPLNENFEDRTITMLCVKND